MPEPTLPRPIMPTLTSRISSDYGMGRARAGYAVAPAVEFPCTKVMLASMRAPVTICLKPTIPREWDIM